MCFLAGAEAGSRAEAVIQAATGHANDQGKALVVEDFPGSKVDMEQLQSKLQELIALFNATLPTWGSLLAE